MLISDGVLMSPEQYADSTPLGVNAQYFSAAGIGLTNAFATYGAIYRAQIWVSTLVNKLAYAVARLPLKTYERAADGARDEVRDHPLAKLLRNPNPRDDHFFFWLWTASTFEVYGEAIWVKVRPAPGRPPTQLWPMHPANVVTQRNRDTGDLEYRFQIAGSGQPLMQWSSADVVHFKGYNPDNQVRGMSRLEPLRQTILNEDSARRAAAAMWQNGGRPGMAVSHPGTLSDGALDRLKNQWDSIHTGVDAWGKTAILEEGMTPHMFRLNAEELQYIESRKMNREEACAAYDVPPPVVHILDRATFSNITEQMRSQYRDTMPPRLSLYESAMDAQLRPDFDPQGKVYSEFLLDEVLRGAFEQRSIANQAAIHSGQRTPNEVRAQDNLPPLEGGDKLYINAASVPLGVVETIAEVNPVVPKPKAELVRVIGNCVACLGDGPLSPRDLCRSCEGKASRMAQPKEITS